jgi:hypothetical protein
MLPTDCGGKSITDLLLPDQAASTSNIAVQLGHKHPLDSLLCNPTLAIADGALVGITFRRVRARPCNQSTRVHTYGVTSRHRTIASQARITPFLIITTGARNRIWFSRTIKAGKHMKNLGASFSLKMPLQEVPILVPVVFCHSFEAQ